MRRSLLRIASLCVIALGTTHCRPAGVPPGVDRGPRAGSPDAATTGTDGAIGASAAAPPSRAGDAEHDANAAARAASAARALARFTPPDGYTLLSDDAWDGDEPTVNGWREAWGRGLVRTLADSTASDGRVVEFRLPEGQPAGEGVGTLYRALGDARSVWSAMRVKFSNPFEMHSSGVQKIAYIQTPGAGSIYLAVYGAGHELRVFPQFSTSRGRWLTSGKRVRLGQFHDIAWEVDARVGSVKVWLDGELVMYGATLFPPPGVGNLSEYQLTVIWGGMGGSKRQTDTILFDRVVVATR